VEINYKCTKCEWERFTIVLVDEHTVVAVCIMCEQVCSPWVEE
jgi:hypothetical protein